MVWEPPFDADSVDTEIDPASFDMMVTNLLDDSFEPLLPPWNGRQIGRTAAGETLLLRH